MVDRNRQAAHVMVRFVPEAAPFVMMDRLIHNFRVDLDRLHGEKRGGVR